MRRMTHRLAVLGVVGGLALAMSAMAVSGPAMAGEEPPGSDTGCAVEHLDERGAVTDTSVEPKGAVYGEFGCVGGHWEFAWAPFGPDDAITADAVQVDPAGTVSVRQFAGPALAGDVTMAEIAGIARAIGGGKDAVIDRAVVAVDDGRERSPAEIEALLAGKDTTGAKVLKTIDRPDPSAGIKGITDGVGGQEPTVVYFSILGALKDAFSWVVDKIHDAVDWVKENCTVRPSGLGVVIVCTWSY